MNKRFGRKLSVMLSMSCLLVLLFGMTVHATYGGVTGGGVVIRYTDGCGGQVFEDRTFEAKEGENTPAYDKGTPYREGYTFAGWQPEVQALVESDMTYTAQWAKNDAGAASDGNQNVDAGSGNGQVNGSNAGQTGQDAGTGTMHAANSQNQANQANANGDQATPDVDTWDANLMLPILLCAAFLAFAVGGGFLGYGKFRHD